MDSMRLLLSALLSGELVDVLGGSMELSLGPELARKPFALRLDRAEPNAGLEEEDGTWRSRRTRQTTEATKARPRRVVSILSGIRVALAESSAGVLVRDASGDIEVG